MMLAGREIEFGFSFVEDFMLFIFSLDLLIYGNEIRHGMHLEIYTLLVNPLSV